jgi:hypothetical protein
MRFIAVVLADHRAMLDVFRDGFDARVSFEDGVERVEFATASWKLARERFSGLPKTTDTAVHRCL